MQTLHISLQPRDQEHVELRYFFDNPNQYQERSLPAQELTDLIAVAERDYYTRCSRTSLRLGGDCTTGWTAATAGWNGCWQAGVARGWYWP